VANSHHNEMYQNRYDYIICSKHGNVKEIFKASSTVRLNTFFCLQCFAKHSSTMYRNWNECKFGLVNPYIDFKLISSDSGKLFEFVI
jgi:hypothetical protein